MNAPFPYFGGKRSIADEVWRRLGAPTHYIEPFCGSMAVLLAAPRPAPLEVVCDMNGFIANFWRAVKHQPDKVAEWTDYPVSHIDLGARHRWLMDRRSDIEAGLHDAEWPGDAQAAGWWLYGQCSWIGSGWCEWDGQQRQEGRAGPMGKIPHVGDAGMGVQARGKIPHVSNAGRGVQARGKIPHVSDAGRGDGALLTTAGRAAWVWLHQIAERLERVRIVHGDWHRCLNSHFGGADTAVFLDPPYRAFEALYGASVPVADAVEAWARENSNLRIALCGHRGDYELPGWEALDWSRGRLTYGGSEPDSECIWFSPACIRVGQMDLFADLPIPEPPEEARLRELFAEPEVGE